METTTQVEYWKACLAQLGPTLFRQAFPGFTEDEMAALMAHAQDGKHSQRSMI